MAAILSLDRDLPLADTPASRFLAWIAGGLVFLAVVALALAAAANGTARRLALEPRIVTIALPATTDRAPSDDEIAAVKSALEELEGVAYVRLVAPQELGRVIEPWLAQAGDLATLPIPRLLDVAFNPGREPDRAALAARLATLAPGATVDQMFDGDASSARAAHALRSLALGAAALVVVALVVVVVRVTRMSLDQHQETVDLLRLMGAADDYVGRQFERHALSSALRGGLLGFSGAILAVGTLTILQAATPDSALPRLELAPVDWLLLACVPVAAALLTALVARRTARWGLVRLR